jgi:peptide deformylase
MLETMYAAPGVGLAASQTGIRKRVIVVDAGENVITLANPAITAAEGEQAELEGYLAKLITRTASCPSLVSQIPRASRRQAS